MNSNITAATAAPAADAVSHSFTLEPHDAQRLAALCGPLNAHLKQIEKRLNVTIHNRGAEFALSGDARTAGAAAQILQSLYAGLATEPELTADQVHLALQQSDVESAMVSKQSLDDITLIRTAKCTVRPRGANQQRYVKAVQSNDINFGIGPAGTGKTYLAVACAVEALLKDEIERILLVRPAVEAGEKLGFLPGDLSQKVDPYLRPLYDALWEMLGFDTVGKLIERNVIEVAPLAYMRGRTLNNAYVILDEAQNTTREQMKMFLTRIGFGSTAVITGDPSQIDLPRGQHSGLKHVMEVLDKVAGISFTYFQPKDVVRHPLVQRIVEAYDEYDARQPKSGGL
ncbi:PhoH family protein [Simiduia agarivorans]|uniref:PhoH-like protein n=1 Tax=Simiduia agarivorans (strain DSM 21679 / JCM 13881 / BCRC 17597 / SA1) TaxID=1117647 RepID=K4KNG8_SIMAS|nr:PhoH family protein [Simiduia agarivorans]AFV00592.1 phosphate starvation-inducible protein PhoH family protein, ATPase [Simiduia agarivorans SA1 = DSM 21679]